MNIESSERMESLHPVWIELNQEEIRPKSNYNGESVLYSGCSFSQGNLHTHFSPSFESAELAPNCKLSVSQIFQMSASIWNCYFLLNIRSFNGYEDKVMH